MTSFVSQSSFFARIAARIVLVAAIALCAASCSVDDNPHRSCASDASVCGPDMKCDRGFCIPDKGETPRKDAGGDSDSGRTDAALDAGDAATDGGDDAALDAGDGGDTGVVDPSMPFEDVDLGKPCDPADDILCFHAPREISTKILGVGVCKAGWHTCNCPPGEPACKRGTWGPCVRAVYPTAESCNGLDDDCDGEKDEEVGVQSCEVPGQKGACKAGTSSCDQANAQLVCTQAVVAKAEECDGIDNDCDGMTDEEIVKPCFPDDMDGCEGNAQDGFTCKGQCATGTQECSEGQLTTCVGFVFASNEACTVPPARTVDEDCDGMTDEKAECACNNGDTFDCYDGSDGELSSGVCMEGTQTCNGGTLSACSGQRMPQDETCTNDGVDDDCDGTADNVPRRDEPCEVASNKGACRYGTRQCMPAEPLPMCVTQQSVPELCNGVDDDCNGVVDNGFNLQIDDNNCGACGVRCTGTTRTCCGGHCVDTASDASHCNGCGNRCGDGNKCCSSVCKNVLTDNTNCRECGITCPGLLLGVLGSCCSGNCSTSLGCGG